MRGPKRLFSRLPLSCRLAFLFAGFWVVIGALSFLLALPAGEHGMAGIILWVVPCAFTLSGRVLRTLYGPAGTDRIIFFPGPLLVVTESVLLGAALGLAIDGTRGRWKPRNLLGAGLVAAWVSAQLFLTQLSTSPPVLAARLHSDDMEVVRQTLSSAGSCFGSDPAVARMLVESIPEVADNAEPLRKDSSGWHLVDRSSSRSRGIVDAVTMVKGIGFWRQYLRSDKGQRSSASLCNQILESAERSVGYECECHKHGKRGPETTPVKAVVRQDIDDLTADVAECFARDLRTGGGGLRESVELARYFPWVLDRYGDLLTDKLAEAAVSESPPVVAFGAAVGPYDSCHGPRFDHGVKGASREEIIRVFGYWHACPEHRFQQDLDRTPTCK